MFLLLTWFNFLVVGQRGLTVLQTYDLCPVDATALATCACQKNQNSLKISQIINTSVKYSCSSHTADISSAQAMFAAYCDLLDGSTKFPTPTAPPGDSEQPWCPLNNYLQTC